MLSRFYAVFGIALFGLGIVFDFLFVEWRLSDSFKTAPNLYLNSFESALYDLTKFYMIVLGLLNIGLASLHRGKEQTQTREWAALVLMVAGAILLLASGIWYAIAGPSFQWEPRCTALTIGLAAIILSLFFHMVQILGDSPK